MRKYVVVGASLASWFFAPQARVFAGLLAYDGFGNGPSGSLDGSTGGTGWTTPWQDLGTLLTSVSAAGLMYPGLASTPGAAATDVIVNWNDSADYVRSFGPYSTPDNRIYISFLYRPESGYGSYGGLQVGTYPTQVQFGAIPGYYLYGLRVGHYGFYPSNIPEVQGETAFIVLEIQHFPATLQTRYRLYVDPFAAAPQPPYADVEAVLSGVPLPSGLELLNDGGVTTDEIRVGTTWTSVVPRLGDVNCDGGVGFLDVPAFVLALVDPAGYATANPTCQSMRGDMNGDGLVNGLDIAGFVSALLLP